MTEISSSEERSLAERLGYSAEEKLLILHIDDMGMCHSANAATMRALEAGIVTCASIMMPCPWMLEAAAYARERLEADLGVHLTLTSEWKSYRWGPVSPVSEVPGLLDVEGYLPRSVREVVQGATPAEVEREIRAQIARAEQLGIRPTHVDSHMGTLFTGPFFPIYTRVAKETGYPPMLVKLAGVRQEQLASLGLSPSAIADALKNQGFVFLDVLNTGEAGDTLIERRDAYYRALENLKPGVTEIILHLSLDDEEIRGITDHWRARWNEFQIFTDPATKKLIDSLGIRLIGYRDLQRVAFQPEASE